jgi:thymidylate synthase ThyX
VVGTGKERKKNKMAERENPQEFTGEDFKKLLRAGFATLKKKGGEVFSKVSHEIDPNVRAERYLRKKYDAMIEAGFDPEHARRAVLEHVERIFGKK